MTNRICPNCGTQLDENQAFCASCGQKISLQVDSNVSSAISQFNAEIGAKSVKTKKLALIAIISVVVIVIISVIAVLSSDSFEGDYWEVSGKPDSHYTFEKESYTYKDEEDVKRGKYKVEENTVTLTDNEGENTVFYRKGDYVFSSKIHYDGNLSELKDGSRVAYKSFFSDSLDYIFVLTLSPDGTYSDLTSITYKSTSTYRKSTESHTESGTYEITDDFLILTPEEKDYTKTYIIYNNQVYDEVYMKKH